MDVENIRIPAYIARDEGPLPVDGGFFRCRFCPALRITCAEILLGPVNNVCFLPLLLYKYTLISCKVIEYQVVATEDAEDGNMTQL
jgi:hypothetical protein